MANIQSLDFNKNVIQVYVEEPGFTGYKGFSYQNLDASLTGLRSDIQKINNKIQTTGDLGVTGIFVYQADLNAVYDNVDVGGYAGADISGINSAVINNFPVYNSIELKYDLSNNNTGVFYKINGAIVREIGMQYDLSNNITGIFKTDY